MSRMPRIEPVQGSDGQTFLRITVGASHQDLTVREALLLASGLTARAAWLIKVADERKDKP